MKAFLAAVWVVVLALYFSQIISFTEISVNLALASKGFVKN